jgi:hypothetical protein
MGRLLLLENGVFRRRSEFGLGCLEISGSGLTTVGYDVEADALPFGQCAEAGLLDGTDVYEHILAPGFRLNKPIPLSGVEKFDSSDSHLRPPDR